MYPVTAQRVLAAAALVLYLLAALTPGVAGIGCFLCSSKNGSDPNCEDPFHPGHSNYSGSCLVAKKNHIGKFPANFCVKIVGRSTSTDETLMIRICVLENMDSQCGLFKFEKEELTGCILTCNDDGCNTATRAVAATSWRLLTAALVVGIGVRSLLLAR